MKKTLLSLLCLAAAQTLPADTTTPTTDSLYTDHPHRWQASISLQTDHHYATARPEGHLHRWSSNTYLNARLHHHFLEIGLRAEELSHPLPGHEEEKGRGIAHLYIKERYKGVELTAGDFYEQFGSGLLLRAYEDRSLGIDNAIRGGHLLLSPLPGATLKLLGGQQRHYFDRDNGLWQPHRGYTWGADLELELHRWFATRWPAHRQLQAGLSLVGKHEAPDLITQTTASGSLMHLNQPTDITAIALRLQLQQGPWELYGEYAHKPNDPQAGNGYIFRSGSVAMLTATYARSGMSLLLGARRSDNFDFRSQRTATQTALRINHLQPFTPQQSYTLAALYPYATQPYGEWALQAELRYRFRKGSWAGGRYGTSLKLAASHISGLKKQWETPGSAPGEYAQALLMGTDGYHSSFFGMGRKYFHDIDIELSKKLSPTYSFVFSYMNQHYNQSVIEGHTEQGGDFIRSHIFVYDGKHKLSRKLSLRTELQFLHTRQADGDWAFGLVECSLLPHFVFSIGDLWNTGRTGKHYYMLSAAGSFGCHRLQLSYGRTRRGINCSGGVCRLMPATEGTYLSYNFSF